MEFKDKLREKRKMKNLKQKEIADMIGLSNVSYAQYEQGKTEPSLRVLIKIAEILETTPNELLGIKKEITEREDFSLILTENENDILTIFKQLAIVHQMKIIGYATALLEKVK